MSREDMLALLDAAFDEDLDAVARAVSGIDQEGYERLRAALFVIGAALDERE